VPRPAGSRAFRWPARNGGDEVDRLGRLVVGEPVADPFDDAHTWDTTIMALGRPAVAIDVAAAPALGCDVVWKTLDDYANSYGHVEIERSSKGIIELRLHHEGGPAVWNGLIHEELGRCFWDVGRDSSNAVVILTGTGDSFIALKDTAGFAFGDSGMTPGHWDAIYTEGRHLISNLLAIEVPVVVAVNGPAIIHSELGVLGDIVIATPDTVFQDTHFRRGMVPGDGVHIIWPELLGTNRGRHYLYMGAELSAQEALRIGVISEIVDRSSLLDRARTIAAELAEQSDVIRRFSRILFTRRMRSLVEAELSHGLALEGVAHRAWPAPQATSTSTPR
jgi:enoyl-CoA hydratase/carnithine racemase